MQELMPQVLLAMHQVIETCSQRPEVCQPALRAQAGNGADVVNHQLVVVPDAAVVPLKVLRKRLVMLKPPVRGVGQQQEPRATSTHRLELPYGLSAVGRVVAGIRAVFGTREVRRSAAAEVQQPIVTFAYDDDVCI